VAQQEVVERPRVLVVDDDAALAEMLTLVLRNEGFLSQIVTRGDEAMAAFRSFRPDVVLLDLMLPGRDGIDVCREIRAESGVPIVMLTARSDTLDVVVGLESGADDYVAKPFKPKELIARIRARVRRFEVPTPEDLHIGDLTIDVTGHAVTRGGKPIGLPEPPQGLHPRGAARAGVGLPARSRHPAGQCARPAAAGEDRGRPGEPHDRGHRARRGLQGGHGG
jgi:two-component system response regulator MtrA